MEQEIRQLKEQVENLSREIDQIKISYSQQTHNGVDGANIDFNNLTGLIKVVTTSTERDQLTATGTNVNSPYRQMFIYYTSTGPAWSLYLYDNVNNVWKSVTIA